MDRGKGGFLISAKRLFILALILLFGGSTVIFFTHRSHASSTVKPVNTVMDKELEVLIAKSNSFGNIYQKIFTETHSKAAGKAFLSYLDALHEGDIDKLSDYSYSLDERKSLQRRYISFYQALDYQTFKVGSIIPERKPNTTKIELLFSINGSVMAKKIEMVKVSKGKFIFYETNELKLVKATSPISDPVLKAIISQYGKWMDYQPVMGIVEFTADGMKNNIAFNYPLLLSLKTEKEIDKLTLSHDYKSYFSIEFEGVNLLISRTGNEVEAEINHSKKYLLRGGEKEMKAMQNYAADFNIH
jgi:hypothetical protein